MDQSMVAVTTMDRIAAREHVGALLSMLLSKIAIEANRKQRKTLSPACCLVDERRVEERNRASTASPRWLRTAALHAGLD
jgi:hypothetical protein